MWKKGTKGIRLAHKPSADLLESVCNLRVRANFAWCVGDEGVGCLNKVNKTLRYTIPGDRRVNWDDERMKRRRHCAGFMQLKSRYEEGRGNEERDKVVGEIGATKPSLDR